MPDILYDIEEYPSARERDVNAMQDVGNNYRDSSAQVEKEDEQYSTSENFLSGDELTQSDGNFSEVYDVSKENLPSKGQCKISLEAAQDKNVLNINKINIQDIMVSHPGSRSQLDPEFSNTFCAVLSTKKNTQEDFNGNQNSRNISPEVINDKAAQVHSIDEENENKIATDKLSQANNDNTTQNAVNKLNIEMMNKLMEIKTKWKNLCENIIALDETDNVNELDQMFQSIGLSLETPKIKSEPQKVSTEIPTEVKLLQDIVHSGCLNEVPGAYNCYQQTYAQVYIKYKKNKNMITGSQIPLHRIMSTLFDPKKLQVQHMNKWLNVDNYSKRFVCGMEGVMSIVQAFSMKNELFALKHGVKGKRPHCGPYDGIADIIWQAGDGISAIVVQYETQFSYTRLFECLDTKICFNLNEVRSELASIYTTPQPPIALILSVLLTRGLDRVQTDMANCKVKTLLTQEGDETWSLILLLLIGQAVGHIMHTQFPKNWNPVRSPIGILSLDEYGEKVYVSPFFKTPRFPLWLLHYCHDGNHYSLLFGHCRQLLSDWKEEKNFTLHHWDFDVEEMKTVQIRTTGRITQDPDEVRDVLEMIVRTKWPIANIDIKPSAGSADGGGVLSVEQFPSLRRRLFSRPLEQIKAYSCF